MSSEEEREAAIRKELETPEGRLRVVNAMAEPKKEFCVLEYCRSPGCDGWMKEGSCVKCGGTPLGAGARGKGTET
jgi:hypothetical protein